MDALTENGSDDRTREAVETELQWISEAQIDVLVTDGVVTLSGEVSSAAEKRLAGLAAWSSPHVRWVENGLRVARSREN